MKKVSGLFGVDPDYASELEQAGIRTVGDLSQLDNAEEVSARTGVPHDLLLEWREQAREEIQHSRYRRKPLVITMLLTAVALSGVALWSYFRATSVAEDPYVETVMLYEMGEHAAAAQRIDEALAEGRNTAELHNLRGIIYRQASQPEQAVEQFRKALAFDGDYAPAWNNLANAYLDLKNTAEAGEAYKKAIQLSPQVSLYHHNLARIWVQLENLIDAEREYLAAIEFAPAKVEYYQDLSTFYQEQKKTNRAEEILRQAVSNNPKSDEAFASLGVFHFDAQRYREAGTAYRRAAELNPKKLSHWQKAARAFRIAQIWDEALAAYERVNARVPLDWGAHFYAGWVLLQMGEPSREEAIRRFHEVLAIAPDDERNKWCYLNLAVAYAAGGEVRKVEEAISKALLLDPDFVPAIIQRGLARQSHGRYDEAEEFYQQAIRVDPGNTVAYFNLVQVYSTQAKHSQAQRELRTLQTLAPDDKYTQWSLAEEQSAQENFAEAVNIYKKTLRNYPDDIDTLSRLAEVQIQEGQKNQDLETIQDGIRLLEQLIEKDPTFASGYFRLAWTYHVIPLAQDLDMARSFYNRGLVYAPRYVMALNNLAWILLEQGDIQGFAKQNEKILQINPGYASALSGLGYSLFLLGDLNGALEQYRRALAIAPQEEGNHVAIAEVLIWLGNLSEAHNELALERKALARPERSGSTWTLLLLEQHVSSEKRRVVYYYTVAQKRALVDLLEGLAYIRENNLSDALKYYRLAAKGLTSSHEDQEVVRKAIDDLHRLKQELPGNTAVDMALGYLIDWLGDHERAA